MATRAPRCDRCQWRPGRYRVWWRAPAGGRITQVICEQEYTSAVAEVQRFAEHGSGLIGQLDQPDTLF